jgi:hypothetical protein
MMGKSATLSNPSVGACPASEVRSFIAARTRELRDVKGRPLTDITILVPVPAFVATPAALRRRSGPSQVMRLSINPFSGGRRRKAKA